MRFLILAVALAFTASPALGQFRPEIPQWAEQGNALDQNHFGLMYDLDWDVPQDDTEDVRWKPILIGAGIGFTLGSGIGWLKEGGPYERECITLDVESVDCLPVDFWDRPYAITITGSLIGAGVGAVIGWRLPLGPFTRERIR